MADKLLSKIAGLLPEGLDEKVLESIATLISSKIQEEVKTAVSDLTIKVTSFIRGNIEKLKEHAVKELELENETFRDAQMLQTIKSFFALENTADDEITGAGVLASIGESQELQIDTLAKELEKTLTDNVTLRKQNKVLSDKGKKLEESLTNLSEQVEKVKIGVETKKMSDKGIVVSEQNFKIGNKGEKQEKPKANQAHQNEWLNESVISASKQLNKIG